MSNPTPAEQILALRAIDISVLTVTLNYLATRPFNEVEQLIGAIKQTPDLATVLGNNQLELASKGGAPLPKPRKPRAVPKPKAGKPNKKTRRPRRAPK